MEISAGLGRRSAKGALLRDTEPRAEEPTTCSGGASERFGERRKYTEIKKLVQYGRDSAVLVEVINDGFPHSLLGDGLLDA